MTTTDSHVRKAHKAGEQAAQQAVARGVIELRAIERLGNEGAATYARKAIALRKRVSLEDYERLRGVYRTAYFAAIVQYIAARLHELDNISQHIRLRGGVARTLGRLPLTMIRGELHAEPGTD